MLICEQVTMAPVVTAMDHLLPLSSPSLSSSSSPLYFQECGTPNPQATMHYSDYKVDDFLASRNTTSYCNSYGSELYDSVCAAVTQQIELSQISEREKAIVIVSADSDSVTKVGDAFGQRTSVYRGVTRHRWTGRYEAHLWDNSCRREGQARKGRQVYLGGYDKEEKAARAYDLAVLKYWGPTASINFPITNYSTELEEMKHATKQEFIASLRRKSSGFSRGASMYRGVTRHHQQGRWQARIGRVAGNKDLYLGTFATEEEAAEAYDIAAIKFRGVNAVTNFEMNRYNVEAILNSNLPVGGLAKRLKKTTDSSNKKPNLSLNQQSQCNNSSSCTSRTINFGANQTSASSFDTATTTMSSISHQSLLHHLSFNAGVAQGDSSELFFGSGITPMTLVQHTPAELYIWPHQTC